jgi:hypothetical protein
MNDYLGRIAQRSLDAPTLDPRLPSLFEPVRHAGLRLPVGEVEGADPVSASGEPAVTRPRHASGPTTGPPQLRTPPHASAESAEPAEHDTRDDLARDGISLRLPERMPAVTARAAAEDQRVLRIPVSLAPPSLLLPTTPPVLRDAARRDLITEPDPAPARSISRIEAVSPRRQPSVLLSPSERSGLKAEPVPWLSPKIQAEPLPRPPGHSRHDERPIVHVTIGRVEVRATPPPAARPRPQAPAPPVMSLEEYLRLRASESAR